MQEPVRLSRFRMILFSMGQFGWSLSTFVVGSLVIYFYFPPSVDGGNEIPAFIIRSTVFLGMTIVGLASFSGRIFDAVTDPIIASMTDRSKNRFGRRRIFMLISFIPCGLMSVFVFTPPFDSISMLNAIWLVGAMLLFYLFSTMYTQAWSALIPEIGHNADDRMFLATIISVTWALGFAVGQTVWALKDLFQGMGMAPAEAFRLVIIIFSVLSIIAMGIPIAVIDEKKHCRGHVSSEGTFAAVIKAFQNRDFAIFTVADFCYFIGNTFLAIGVIYYVTILMKLPESMATLLMTVMFVFSFLFYLPIYYLSKRIGKKKMQIIAFALLAMMFALMPFVGMVSRPEIFGWALILLAAVPVAIFGIMPTAFLADIAKSDGIRTGNHKEAVFYGARSFSIKLAISIANLIFPTLLILGSSTAAGKEPSPTMFGVSATAVVALVFTIIGGLIFLGYNEQRVNSYLAQEEDGMASDLNDDDDLDMKPETA